MQLSSQFMNRIGVRRALRQVFIMCTAGVNDFHSHNAYSGHCTESSAWCRDGCISP